MNPLLTLISSGLGYLGGAAQAVGKPGCSVILATPCPDQWDEIHHPSYREVWEDVLSQSHDPYEIQDRTSVPGCFDCDFKNKSVNALGADR